MKKILIICNHQLQSFAQALALVQLLEPHAEISLASDQNKIEFWQSQTSVKQVFNFDENVDFLKRRKQLKAHKYDLCINLDPTFTARILCCSLGIKNLLGHNKYWFPSPDVSRETLLNELSKQFNIPLKSFDLKPFLDPNKLNDLIEFKTDLQQKNPQAKLLMIKLLGSKPSKTYPLRKMAKFLDMVHAQRPELFFFINHKPSQSPYAKDLLALCSPSTQSHILQERYTGQLSDFLAQLYVSDALMGNPSGVPHLADLLNKKSFFIRPAQSLIALGNPLFTEVHIDDYLKDINHDHQQQLKKETFAMARQQRFEPELFAEKLQIFVANI